MGNARGRDGRRGRVDGMARGARKRSAKRAKVDKADKKEEEDPLVRRREELVLGFWNARAEGKKLVREAEVKAKLLEQPFLQDMRPVCADIQAKNEKLLRRLPPELWDKILDGNLHQNDLLAFAMTCRFFREKQKGLGKKLKTNVDPELLNWWLTSGKMASHTLGWFQWVCDTFEIMPGFTRYDVRVKGAVYEGDLLNYALFQGSVEILGWLMEEKGWELKEQIDWWAGTSGSVEVFEFLRGRGYEFGRPAFVGAAEGGRLEALKFLRGLDPPCPWDWTCTYAARQGQLDIVKWLRSQEPPCPWGEATSLFAAENGRLEVLKWLRAQNPPCPWRRSACREEAWENDHQHIVKWIDQQED